ncbi:hypothetical protein [Sphingomonas daechungensis]|uniref:hypothetical protein n=1 Tax=Sphingomonas daechungensis TaxID=1176646 RepID=UPI003783B365
MASSDEWVEFVSFLRLEKLPREADEVVPAGLLLQQEVIVSVERHKGRLRDVPGEIFPGRERNDLVVAGMEDQRRHGHLRQEIADIDQR